MEKSSEIQMKPRVYLAEMSPYLFFSFDNVSCVDLNKEVN